MSNQYGLVGTEGSVDIPRSSDYQHIIDSRFFGMNILYEQLYEPTPFKGDHSAKQIIYEHGLGYVPLVFTYEKQRQVQPFVTPSTVDSVFQWKMNNFIRADKKYLFMDDDRYSLYDTPPHLYFYIFGVNMEQNYLAPEVSSSTSQVYRKGDYGLKTAVEGKSVNSLNKQDFKIDSSMRSLELAIVAYGAGEDYTDPAFPGDTLHNFYADHNLGYPPVSFGALWLANAPGGGNSVGLVDVNFIDNNRAGFTGLFNNPPYTVICLKTPFQPAESPIKEINYG